MITANKPHPLSYGAHLPLKPLTFAQLTATTREERKQLAARPIMLKLVPEAEVIERQVAREMPSNIAGSPWMTAKQIAKRKELRARAAETLPAKVAAQVKRKRDGLRKLAPALSLNFATVG